MLILRPFLFFFLITLIVQPVPAQPTGGSERPEQGQPGYGPPGSGPEIRLAGHPERDRIRVDLLIRELRRPFAREDSIRIYAKEALSISKEINFKAGEARVYGALGDFFGLKDQTDSTYYYSGKSYELSREIGDRQGMAAAGLGLGIALSRLGHHKEAQEYYIEVLGIYEEAGDNYAIGRTYERIGSLYIRQGETNLGISNFKKALDAFSNSDREYVPPPLLQKLASAYMSIGNHEKALSLLEQGIEIDKKDPRVPFIPLYATRGRLYLTTYKFEAAENDFLYAIEVTERERQSRGVSPFYYFLAETKYKQQDLPAAREYAKEALRILDASQIKDEKGRVGILSLLSNIEKESGDFERALSYMSMAKISSDSSYREENLKAIADIQTKYETEKKEQEILLLQSEKKADRRLAVMIILEILWVFVVTGIIFWYRAKRKEQQRKLEQQSLQREMEQYGTLIAEKDSFITNTINKLDRFRSHLKSIDAHKELNTLVDSLRQNIDLVDDEEHLLQRIEQVNSGFFFKLDKQTYGLTKRDKRLASLLNMGLSSKEIGSILGINSRSVMQAKYRLKKKLGLEGEEDLDQFLKSLYGQ